MLTEKIEEWAFPYQLRVLRDPAKKGVVLKARRIGITTILALKIVLHCLRHDNHAFYIVGTTESLAAEILRVIKTFWLPVFEACGQPIALSVDNKTQIEFASNASRIVAVSTTMANKRGLTGSFLWDEAAFLADRELGQLESTVMPIVDSPLNPECIFWVVSTPWAKEGLYWDIWSNEGGFYDEFSRHQIDVYQAIDDGYPFDEEKLRKMPQSRRQREYECKPMEVGIGFFAKALLLELQTRTEEPGTVFAGIDLGKKRDPSSMVLKAPDGHTFATYLVRGQQYRKQVDIFSDVLDQYQVAGVGIDETRNETFTELMVERWGSKVHGRHFTRAWKKAIVEAIDDRVAQGAISYDFGETYEYDGDSFTRSYTRQLLEDFLSVQQRKTRNGNITYKIPREQDDDGHTGHGDSFAAEMLAVDVWLRAAVEDNRSGPSTKDIHDLASPIDLGY